MLNQHDTHGSDNPANQEENKLPSWDSIMDKLTPEENEVVYNELYDRQAPMRKLKALQVKIDVLEKEKDDLQVSTFGGTYNHVEYNKKYSRLYDEIFKLETKQKEIIRNHK